MMQMNKRLPALKYLQGTVVSSMNFWDIVIYNYVILKGHF